MPAKKNGRARSKSLKAPKALEKTKTLKGTAAPSLYQNCTKGVHISTATITV
jgi:hypothetical protein